ncbi:DUF3021 family protein [Fructilactobacillus sanfranciscensis]|nr:DUF3021 family protein [Fructilactobacillus sanfranciscensis]MDN4462493.1 DUF3021 family protein [Fructilactobacillus sanfranciscensis]NDR60342.1 DUF3021 family protein [Fructilactobacillus sanfranciscensis]NDR61601.1 DUF3021 family protein [Fructilactobacillus sanfranciscensis]
MNSWHGLLIVVINFLVIYLLVWLGIIVWNKASAKEINKQLNKFNQK